MQDINVTIFQMQHIHFKELNNQQGLRKYLK